MTLPIELQEKIFENLKFEKVIEISDYVLKWFYENRIEDDVGYQFMTMDIAAASGHLAIIVWIHETLGAQCPGILLDFAAMNGHLETVKWLHEHIANSCTTAAMDLAAMYGHLEVVKWLHYNRSEGCTSEAVKWAIMYNHIEVVKFLIKFRFKDCNINNEFNDQFDIDEWIRENS